MGDDHMKMLRGLVAAVLVLLMGTAGGRSGTGEALAKYNPAEVQMLRDQAKASGIALTDSLLLSTLQARDDCRTISAALRAIAAGQSTGDAMKKLAHLPEANRKRGQNEQAAYFQTAVDKALLGDPSVVTDYHDQNCADVK
jgi:hypothetical protein